MSRIRVLVIDDAVVVRRIVSDVLNSDPALEVVATAATGIIGLSKIPQVKPDVITLDVEMPDMDGLETLTEIRKLYPKLPVIMFSTLTERGAYTTLEALSKGANDFVTKPANVGSVAAAQQSLRDQLIPKIKTFCRKEERFDPRLRTTREMPARPVATPIRPKSKGAVINVVAIGVSTGGPNALGEILPAIPDNFPVPIVVVQHMPPMFTKLLAERLDKLCRLNIHEGANGDQVKSGHAYFAPGGYHMVLKRELAKVTISLQQETPENSCRPAVDVLFRSVVQSYGPGTLGVILTGMGQDGLRGCEYIRDVGGQVISQDQESSAVWGMPGFVAKAGLTDLILPLNRIADEIMKRVRKGRDLDETARPA